MIKQARNARSPIERARRRRVFGRSDTSNAECFRQFGLPLPHSGTTNLPMTNLWQRIPGIIFSRGFLETLCTPDNFNTRRLLGEAPRDIESPLGSSGTSIGVEVTPLQFTAEHQTVLLAASREILSLQEDGSNVADARTNSDDARLGSHKRPKAALLATGVTGLFAGLYAARHTVFPFLKFW